MTDSLISHGTVLRTRLRFAPRILGRPAWFDETLGCRPFRRRGGEVDQGIGCLAQGGTMGGTGLLQYGSVKLVGGWVERPVSMCYPR